VQIYLNQTLGVFGMPLANGVPKRIATLAKAVEPVMLLVMGFVVGLIVASLILPIFKLSRAVH
jgi:type II secretory pathway component PulF